MSRLSRGPSIKWKNYFHFWVNAILVTIPAELVYSDPQEWSGNGHSYEVVATAKSVTWFEAAARAESSGGYLATIVSREENDFVFSLVNSSAYWFKTGLDHIGPWIGGYQPSGSREPDGNWQWVTGEPFLFQSWLKRTSEPNNAGGNEDGIFFYNAFSDKRVADWNDFNREGSLPKAFVIEYDHLPLIPENLPPVIKPISNSSTLEDHPSNNLKIFVSDDSTPFERIAINLTSSNQEIVPNANLALEDHGAEYSLIANPLSNQNGVTEITVTAMDEEGLIAKQAFELNIVPVNDSPTLDEISDQDVWLDSSIQIGLSGITTGAVNETDFLDFSVSIDGSGVVSETIVSYVQGETAGFITLLGVGVGRVSIDVTIDDRGSENSRIVRSFSVSVLPRVEPNTSPQIEPIADQTVKVGETLPAIEISVLDKETEVESLEVWVESLDEARLSNDSFSAWNDDAGNWFIDIGPVSRPTLGSPIPIRVTVSDRWGATDSTEFSLYVVYEEPEIELIRPSPSELFQKGETIVLEAEVSDADGVVSSVVFSIEGMKFAEVAEPPYVVGWDSDVSGFVGISATAVDEYGLESQAANLQVKINTAPTISAISMQRVGIGGTKRGVAVEVSDRETEVGSLEVWVDSLDEARLSNDSFSAWNDDAGNWFIDIGPVSGPTLGSPIPIRVTVSDGCGATDSTEFSLYVVNEEPEIDLIRPSPSELFQKGETIVLEAEVSDVDGAVSSVVFSIEGMKFAEVAEPPYVVSWDSDVSGFVGISATAVDEYGLESQAANIQVKVNTLPMIREIPYQRVGIGGKIIGIPVEVSDHETKLAFLNVSVESMDEKRLPSELLSVRMGQEGGWFIDIGPVDMPTSVAPLTILLTVSDDWGGAVETKFDLEVFNERPEVSITKPFEGERLASDDRLTIETEAIDLDGEVVSVTFFLNGQKLLTREHPPFDITGDFKSGKAVVISAVAVDNFGLSSVEASVSVTFNSPPVIKPIADQLLKAGDRLNDIPIEVSDLETELRDLQVWVELEENGRGIESDFLAITFDSQNGWRLNSNQLEHVLEQAPVPIRVWVEDSDEARGSTDFTLLLESVQNTKPPIIILNGDNPQMIECHGLYKELGAMARANTDAQLGSVVIDSSAVKVGTPGTYMVTYDILDSNGNAAVQMTRTVIVRDTAPPVILLEGGNPQFVELGEPYVELGARVLDACDLEIETLLIDSSSVNTGIPGHYNVAYDSWDSSGNMAAQVIRTIIVRTPQHLGIRDGNDRLTYEEGAPPILLFDGLEDSSFPGAERIELMIEGSMFGGLGKLSAPEAEIEVEGNNSDHLSFIGGASDVAYIEALEVARFSFEGDRVPPGLEVPIRVEALVDGERQFLTQLTVEIMPVNDAPVIRAPLFVTASQSETTLLDGIEIMDPDRLDGREVMLLDLQTRSGRLLAPESFPGLDFVSNGNGFQLSGPLNQMNLYLQNGVLYQPGPDARDDVMTVEVNDLGSHGSGDALATVLSVPMRVCGNLGQLEIVKVNSVQSSSNCETIELIVELNNNAECPVVDGRLALPNCPSLSLSGSYFEKPEFDIDFDRLEQELESLEIDLLPLNLVQAEDQFFALPIVESGTPVIVRILVCNQSLSSCEPGIKLTWGRGARVTSIVSIGQAIRPSPPLGVVRNEDLIVLEWGCGVLESAASVTGPWVEISGACSPLLIPNSNSNQFFRRRSAF